MDKESPFYSEVTYSERGDNGWDDFFSEQKEDAVYFLEGTTHTAFQKIAPQVLENYGPDLKLILMLRDPAERIRSSFYYTRNNIGFIKSGVTFERYVEDLLNKQAMDYITNDSSRYVLSRELEYSDYSNILDRWTSKFNREQLFVGVFEDMVRNPESFYTRLFSWLQIEKPDIQQSAKNQTIAPKSLYLQQVLAKLNRKFRSVPFKKKLKSIYFEFFSEQKVADKADMEALNKLKLFYSTSIKNLKSKYNINTDLWNYND